MTSNPDNFYKSLRKAYNREDPIEWEESGKRLRELVVHGTEASGRKHVFRKITKYHGENRDIRILDFGCGGGQTVVYLRMLGYEHAYGAGILSQDANVGFAEKLGIRDTCFFEYDARTLPFREGCFDMIISEQVLEHVRDIETYYAEAARVLKKGGIAYVNYPHRLIPYDSHSRTWFIHYFPRVFRRFLFRMIGRDPDYLEAKLNLKTPAYHRKVASRYFSEIRDETRERLLAFEQRDLAIYEGNRFLRKGVDRAIRSRLSGPVLLPFLSRMSNADICLVK